jgi:nitrogenase molybdenum-iron protein beta chain
MLDKTPIEEVKRSGLVINPAKTCQPVGAMYAALGVNKCLPHSHGSQGCCSFHRMFLTRNFRDPVMASTSSFTEGSAVFGGGSNLKTSIKNIFEIYQPDIIAVHTTCLSETIGDDIPTYIMQSQVPEGKVVVHANTPSYVGSHVTGFSNMVKGFIKYLATKSDIANEKINIIPGFVNPADMREMKRIMSVMGIKYVMLPDTSGVVDAPMNGTFDMYPKGGTKVKDIIDSGNSKFTLCLGKFASEAGGMEYERKCDIPFKVLKTPIGIKATDEFIMKLSAVTGVEIPYELEEERGQVIDIMVDCHNHYHGKKIAIFGDPDFAIAMTEFVLSLGMIPKYVVTGTPGEYFEKEVGQMLEAAGVEGKAKSACDLFTLHQWIKQEKVDVLLGGTHGKYIARAEDIPFVRAGFPILDRAVHSYMPLVGYRGTMRLLEMIGNAILDRQDRDASDEDLEMIL